MPAQNRSLERGIEILRAFRQGSDLLGNGELAERTGLSRATVSRLTQTLVGTGMLDHDGRQRAYRLAAPVLSLAHAMRSGSPILHVAAPLMLKVAEKLKINVGLAIRDREDMVYLESVRYNRKVALRNVVAGQRVPIELTSLGRAYLAVAPEDRRRDLIERFRKQRAPGWAALDAEIRRAIRQVHTKGYCVASWQPQVVAVATPLEIEGYPIHVMNASVITPQEPNDVAAELAPALLALAAQVVDAMRRAD
jgi:DNA-binding IclR family transcriptional regulator